MWDLMVKKETGMYRRLSPAGLLARHPAIQPRMRAILLDWLIEVCEVYRLHRETFYLAVDFIDRFLSVAPAVPKNRLQLIGVSCLFIGAKIEEIYPPKLQEFAYVTGECRLHYVTYLRIWISKKLNKYLFPLAATSSTPPPRRSVYGGGDPADGADGAQGAQLGPVAHDAQRLDADVPADDARQQGAL